MKVLYVTYENVYRTPILQAMVLKPLSLLAENHGISFIVTSSVKPHENDAMYEENKSHFEAQKHSGITVTEFQKKLTKKLNPFRFLFDLFPMIKYSISAAKNCDVIHCRSYGGAIIGMIASFSSGTPFIFDMRGTLPEEMLELGELQKESVRFKVLKWVERLLIHRASYILTVSNAFNEYITSTFKKSECVNVNNPTDFQSYTPSQAANGKVNFIYSGSMQAWHLPDVTIQYFQEIQKRFPDKVYLRFCTNDLAKATTLFKDYDIPSSSYEVVTVPFRNMPAYYAKSQMAFHFIRNSFSKSVCFPVKFSEYIASELFVLANEGIGDIADIVNTHQCGLVFSDLSDLEKNVEEICEFVQEMLDEEYTSYNRNNLDFLNWHTEGIDKIFRIYETVSN